MSDYEVAYEESFLRNLRRYAGKRQQIRSRVERVLADQTIVFLTVGPHDRAYGMG